MTRKKVKLVWIANDTARKASLKKRRFGLLKKVSELTTLCGVSAFAIIYSPDDSDPAVWPSRPMVQQLLTRFQGMPEMERSKKMTNQESYLRERIGKAQDQLKKHQRLHKEMEMSYLMHQLQQGKRIDDFDLNELHGLAWLVEEKLKDIRKRVEYFQQVPSLPPGPFPPRAPNMQEMGGTIGSISQDERNPTEPTPWDQLFIDIVNNNNENAAGSSSNIKGGTGLAPMARAFNIAGSSSGGFSMGLHHGTAGSSAGSILGLRPPYSGNVGGSTGGNTFGLGLPHHGNSRGSTSGSNMGQPPIFFGGVGDMGPPFDITKFWTSSFPS